MYINLIKVLIFLSWKLWGEGEDNVYNTLKENLKITIYGHLLASQNIIGLILINKKKTFSLLKLFFVVLSYISFFLKKVNLIYVVLICTYV